MKTQRLGCMAAALLLSAASYADTTAVNAGDALAKLLGGFTTFTASFTQQVMDGKGAVVQRNNGNVQIARPGKFRWVSNVPTKQIIIANGPVLWTYDVDLEQATKQPFQAAGGVTPANLLSGKVSDLQQQFTVTTLPTKGQDQAFRLTPKQPSDLFKSVDMDFSGQQLSTMRVLNNLGQTVQFSFQDVKLNPKLDDKLFDFQPPKGVDVITNE